MSLKEKFALAATFVGTAGAVVVTSVTLGMDIVMNTIPLLAIGGAGVAVFQFNKAQKQRPLGPVALGAPIATGAPEKEKNPLFFSRIFLAAAAGIIASLIPAIRITEHLKTPEQKRQDKAEQIEHACKPYNCVKNNDGSYTIPAPK